MTDFQYNAVNKLGDSVAGQISASSIEEAIHLLEDKDLRDLQLTEIETAKKLEENPGKLENLSTTETDQFVERLANLSHIEAPLASGLRAAAAETSSRRLAAVLQMLAVKVEQGQPFEQAVQQTRGLFPQYVGGLISAAIQAGNLNQAVTELVDHRRGVRERRRLIVSSLTYPGVILGFALAIFLVFNIFVVPIFREMFEDFQLSLSPLTSAVLNTNESVTQTIAIVVPVVLVVLGLLRLVAGRPRWGRMLATVPFIGSLWYWSGATEFCRLLAVMVEQNIPLSEALKLTSKGICDANVSQYCLVLAEGVDQGQSLHTSLQTPYRLPASMRPLIRWGEQNGALSEALRTAGEMFERRIEQRSLLLRSVIPPLLFVMVLGIVGIMIFSLFMPLVTLISSLT